MEFKMYCLPHYYLKMYSLKYRTLNCASYFIWKEITQTKKHTVTQLVEATNWKIAGSIPDGATGNSHNPSGRTTVLG